MKRLLKPILFAIYLQLMVLLCSCDTRRPIGQDNWVTVEFSINWEELARATKSEDITPNGATVAFFPLSGGLDEPIFKQTNFTEDKVKLPAGKYNIVVFNETINGHDYIQFTGMDNYYTFEAYWETTRVKAKYSRADNDEMILDTDDLLLVERMEGFEITYDMSFAEETQYLNFTPMLVNRPMTVLTHIKGLENVSKVSASRLYVEGMALGYNMGTGEPTQEKTTHLMPINNKTFDEGSKTNGTMSASFYTFGDAASETKADDDNIVRLSLALRDGTTYRDIEVNVSDQLSDPDNQSEINVVIGTGETEQNPEIVIPYVDNKESSSMDADVNGWGDDIIIDI